MNVTVILPSLNPDEKMVNTVKNLLQEGFDDIVVVNDGSGPEYLKPFQDVEKMDGVTVLTHEVNKGKGRAMKTAFSYLIARDREIAGVVTVDGDGQHLPKDIKRCVEVMNEKKNQVVLGVRDFSGPEVPARSKFGNNMTRAVFRLACGVKISDTQTGLRAIPYQYLPLMVEISGERYEYETNQLLEMKRNDIEMAEVTIDTVYIDDNSSSHFHPIRDSIKIYKIIFKFIFKFIASSLLSSVVDLLLFTFVGWLLFKLMPGAQGEKAGFCTLIATVTARVISSLVNYTANRMVVFESKSSVGSSIWKYYVLCVCQMAASFGLVYLFSDYMLHLNPGFWKTGVKFIVDILLFLISFQIQQRWVFKK